MVDRDEVLRYLGYRGQHIDENLDVLINICRKEVIDKSNPRYIYGYFNIESINDYIDINGTTLKLYGNDIKKHLDGCEKCAILIVTLGAEIEKEIIYNEKNNLTKSIILDACATTYIEEICDKVEKEIKDYVAKYNLNITTRFSPGYGDLPLEIQKEVLIVMNANKRIGVNTTEHSILFPRKSVTAIIGISNKKQENKKRNCSKCNKYNSCIFRVGGKNCGN